MHYIIGTSVSVRPDPKRGFQSRENQFNNNVLYKLNNIAVEQGFLSYIFNGTDRSTVTLNFETSRDADLFIAKLRNERIPDYSANIGKIDV